MRFSPAIPTLRSFDETKLREFYVGFLGFTVDFEDRFEPTAPLFVQLSLGDCRIRLSEHHGDAAPGATVWIETPDLEAFQGSLLAKSYRYGRPHTVDTPWGTREMTTYDPFGNRLVFARRVRPDE